MRSPKARRPIYLSRSRLLPPFGTIHSFSSLFGVPFGALLPTPFIPQSLRIFCLLLFSPRRQSPLWEGRLLVLRGAEQELDWSLLPTLIIAVFNLSFSPILISIPFRGRPGARCCLSFLSLINLFETKAVMRRDERRFVLPRNDSWLVGFAGKDLQ